MRKVEHAPGGQRGSTNQSLPRRNNSREERPLSRRVVIAYLCAAGTVAIWTGFILLSLALASGILFSEEIFGKAMRFSHKTFFALLSWLVFGALLAGRAIWGWRGRLAVRWTVTGFVMLLLAYVGSKFVLEVLLHR